MCLRVCGREWKREKAREGGGGGERERKRKKERERSERRRRIKHIHTLIRKREIAERHVRERGNCGGERDREGGGGRGGVPGLISTASTCDVRLLKPLVYFFLGYSWTDEREGVGRERERERQERARARARASERARAREREVSGYT